MKYFERLSLWKKNNKLRLRIIFFVTFTLWFVFISGIFTWGYFTDKLVKKRLGSEILAVVKTTAVQIEKLDHHKLKTRSDEDTETYKKIVAVLKRVLEANPKIRYLYTARITVDGRMVFIVDPFETRDADGDGTIELTEKKAYIGQVYNEPPCKYQERISAMKGIPTASSEFIKDMWGEWMTAASPLRDKKGEVDAIIAADMSATDVVGYQRKTQRYIFVFSFVAAFIIGITVSFVVAYYVTKPILEMELAARRISEGNFSRELKHAGPAELGTLGKSFNNMRLRIFNERERISQKLHDSIIQIISAAVFQVEYLLKITKNCPAELSKLKMTLNSAIDETRKVILQLSPAKLIEKGLVPAMKYYALKTSEGSGIKYDFDTNLADNFSILREEEIIKIYLEALNNVKYNSGADNFLVVFQKNSDDKLILVVSDDGRGFDVGESLQKEGSFGLKNMLQRAKDNGWRLEIDSAKGGGSIIKLKI